MTRAELLAVFSNRLLELDRTVYHPVVRVPAGPKHDASFHHKFYPIQALPELIRELRRLNDCESSEKYSARYLVTVEGKLLLAREGVPDKSIPKHRGIRSTCLAAGNINFSKEFTITGITHCSGDFCPDPASMAWPLAVLFLLRQVVSPSLTIEERGLNEIGAFVPIASHAFRLEEIHAILPAALSARIIAANSNPTIEVSEYIDPKAISSASRRSRFFEGAMAMGASLFSAEDDTAVAGAGGPSF